MADFLISSLRGGMNDSDPPMSLPDDQCVLARNVEFNVSILGERRRGATAVTITGSGLVGHDRVTFLHRHLPTTNETESELWALAVTGTASSTLAYKDTSWHTVTVSDAAVLTSGAQYRWNAQTLHGKLFIAYKSAVDRLHVRDVGATTLRRTGLAEPAAPTGANTGGVGTFTGTRYYRVRYTVKSGSTTLRRSEPSDVLTFAPSGSNTGVVVTKPASISESETHWELEASIDNANFYVIATTVVGTTTVTDTQDYVIGYAQAFTLSEDVGDYTLIPSGKFLAADEDRLLIGGSWETESLASRVSWTPVLQDPGDGNDERIPLDTDNSLDLDNYEGGGLTGLSGVVDGYVYAFKLHHIYRLVRTGQRTRAYTAVKLTDKRGAIEGSIVEAFDQSGNPTLYFLDPDIGPCRIGKNGIQSCGWDIRETWKTVNLDATNVISRGVYYPEARQVHWLIAVSGGNSPTKRIVLQTDKMRDTDDGARKGWAIWDGPSCEALAIALYAENIDAGVARSSALVPLIGREGGGLLWRTDTGDDDNGTEYTAHIKSKPYVHANIMHQFKIMMAALIAKAAVGASIDVIATRDFGLEQKTVSGVAFDPTIAGEEYVMKVLDSLSFSELRAVQIEFKDVATPGARWELEMFGMKESGAQTG